MTADSYDISAFLRDILDKEVILYLNSGYSLFGTLKSVDEHLNVAIENGGYLNEKTDQILEISRAIVRGNNIALLRKKDS